MQPSAELGALWRAVECPCIAFPRLFCLAYLCISRKCLLITAENSAVRPSPGDPTELAPSPLRSGLGAARGSVAAVGRAISVALSRKRGDGENAAPQQPKPPQPLAPAGKASGAVMAKPAYAFTDHCVKYPCAAPPFARRLARSCYVARAHHAPQPLHSPSRALRRPSQRDLGSAPCF